MFDASRWEIAGEEPQGLQRHQWLRRPGHERLWLFKQANVVRGRALREDQTEKIAAEVARALGVPSAVVELAVRHGQGPGKVDLAVTGAAGGRDWGVG